MLPKEVTQRQLDANVQRAKRAAYKQAMILADHHEKVATETPTIGNRIRAHGAHQRLAEHARAHGDELVASVHETLAEGHRKESYDKLVPGQEYHDGAALEALKREKLQEKGQPE